MKMVLMGHRGTGKSQLLERLKIYFKRTDPQLKLFDLDREIESREGKTIQQIFNEIGEEAFRRLETKVFHELAGANSEYIVALGAGFSLQEIPKEVRRLWVRRKTDALGRIFFNRPRLNPGVSPLEEFLQRLPLREERYRKHATEEYLMPEGVEEPNAIEEKIFRGDFRGIGGTLTVLPTHFHDAENLRNLIRNFEVDYFELRDDLLTLEQIQTFSSLLPQSKILMSLRSETTHPWIREYVKTGVLWDWALELGVCTLGNAPVSSIHRIPPSALASLGELEKFLKSKPLPSSTQLKLAPVVDSFSQLKVLLQWQAAESVNRSVLPRSSSGRWSWVRLWLKGRQKLNFFRLDQGSSIDQPTLYEWMSAPFQTREFAALLGQPVFHSRTPIEHETYFSAKRMPVFAIDLAPEEFEESMEFLDQLGLRAAAVTSPLKLKAFQWAQDRSSMATELESANTLVRKGQMWCAHNTDIDGFRSLLSRVDVNSSTIAVWGGGGTLPVLLKVCPDAICYSARTGKIRLEYGDQPKWSRDEIATMQMEGPRVLIWAASPESNPPPEDWRPEFVLDLNYREDSLAREYALQVGARYFDGLNMFKAQAQAQREFWDQSLK